MLMTLRCIYFSESALSAGILSTKLRKWLPNIVRVLNALINMQLLEIERQGRIKLYKVPSSKRALTKSLIDEATRRELPAQTSPLSESFWVNILYSRLRQLLPPDWGISANEKLRLNRASVSVDLVIRRGDGLRFGIELNVGSPAEHLHSMIGKVMGFKIEDLAMLIVVLLTSHPENHAFLYRITKRVESGWTRFALILKGMPLEPETYGEAIAKKILRLIQTFRI